MGAEVLEFLKLNHPFLKVIYGFNRFVVFVIELLYNKPRKGSINVNNI